MKKIIINENQKGFLFKNGKYVKLLDAGKYYSFGSRVIEVVSISDAVRSQYCSEEVLLADPAIAQEVEVVQVKDCELAMHFVNGNLDEMLSPGRYIFWKQPNRHEFRVVDISATEVDASIPTYIFSKISPRYFTKVEVAEYKKARLYFDQRLVKVLDAGTYYFWENGTRVEVGYVDTRLTQMDVTGQEILTLDKVSLRINFVCSYRVTDYVRCLTEIDDFAEQLHIAAQLALREYVGKYKLDEILENKEQMSAFVLGKLKEKEAELFVEIKDAGVKDIILPGEVRQIMNTVLIAEKRAQANVITRREEVASTRSLLNTAKLMDENQTLYKLKELEYVERICENVGNLTINGNGSVLTQLTDLLKGDRKT